MGPYRRKFNSAVRHCIRSDGGPAVGPIRWLRFEDVYGYAKDRGEILSVDFLHDRGGAAWQTFWPDKRPGDGPRKGVPTWDAAGLMDVGGSREWLLVEAKGHVG
ncbi:hypothetical protein JXD38_03215, partial [candidate division WOR-3 bacterium]|nr:hypothetical protein [candidate division WOR-3 bacterium]